ncbi:MAG: leucine-rich repeat domain-containing protein [Limisphaerales bacterium]
MTELSHGLGKLNQLTNLNLDDNKLGSVKSLGKLTHLKRLDVYNNPNVTKAQIDQLQKALPKCKIVSDND